MKIRLDSVLDTKKCMFSVQLAKTTAGSLFFLDLCNIWSHPSLCVPVSNSPRVSDGSNAGTSCSNVGVALLLLHVAVFKVFIVFNDDQFSPEGAFEFLSLPAVIPCCLKPHEDGCNWLSSVQSVKDCVRGVISVERGWYSVKVGGVAVLCSGSIVAVLCLSVWLVQGWAVAVTSLTDIISRGNITGGAAELWLIGCWCFLFV